MWRECDYVSEMVNGEAAKLGQNMKSTIVPAEIKAGIFELFGLYLNIWQLSQPKNVYFLNENMNRIHHKSEIFYSGWLLDSNIFAMEIKYLSKSLIPNSHMHKTHNGVKIVSPSQKNFLNLISRQKNFPWAKRKPQVPERRKKKIPLKYKTCSTLFEEHLYILTGSTV